MPRISLRLSDEVCEEIRKGVEVGQFGSVSEFVREAIMDKIDRGRMRKGLVPLLDLKYKKGNRKK